METNITTVKKYRKFSEQFKRSIVRDFEAGKHTVNQISKINKISTSAIYRWIHRFSSNTIKDSKFAVTSETLSSQVENLQSKILVLESIVGRKQIKIDFLESMINKSNYETQ